MSRRGVLWAVAAVAAAAVGCGPTVKLAPAGGVVLIDGKPAANVAVQFLPQGVSGPTSFGTTDEQGRFTLKTTDGADGAMVGKHKVTLVDLEEERVPQGQVAKKKPRLSDRYAIPTNGLDAEVTEGGKPIELQATSR
jgi:hypothetical protein